MNVEEKNCMQKRQSVTSKVLFHNDVNNYIALNSLGKSHLWEDSRM